MAQAAPPTQADLERFRRVFRRAILLVIVAGTFSIAGGLIYLGLTWIVMLQIVLVPLTGAYLAYLLRRFANRNANPS